MKLTSLVVGAVAGVVTAAAATDKALLPFVFEPLPLGSIKPAGWLKDQMQLMADGLAGHEADFYRYVHRSSWTGGDQEYSSLNEAFGYWLNGLIPLAYGLDNDRLKAQVQTAVDYIIGHQQSDGWIGPEQTPEARNFWGRYPVFLGLTQLVEADPSQARTIVPAMHKFANLMHSMLADNYTGYLQKPGDDFDASWGRARSHDMIISLQWMYEHYPENNGQTLLDNMKYLNDAAYDWAYWYEEAFIKVDLDTVSANLTNSLYQYEHGVNAGQGLKAGAVVRRFTNNDTLLKSTRDGVNYTFTYHGDAAGSIIADERMIGLAPSRGAELCTHYSLSYLYQTLGDNLFADRCELTAFNALPATVTSDWWAHQYMMEVNQPYSVNLTETPFFNVNTLGQTFGLEPNYPCYPKFASASFVKVGDNGLAHALLSPATATATLGSGNKVTVTCDTNYPFESTLQYTINADKTFDFHVRVPGWYVSASSFINFGDSNPGNRGYQPQIHQAPQKLSPDTATGMHKISVPAGTSTIGYTLGADVVVEPRSNDTVAIHHGALLYALTPGQTVQKLPPRDWQNKTVYPTDYYPPQVHDTYMLNTSAWNIAIDPSTVKFQSKSSSSSSSPASSHMAGQNTNGHRPTSPNTTPPQTQAPPLPNPIFAPGAPPTSITAMACEIGWPIYKGVPSPLLLKRDRACLGGAFEVSLVPYGAAKLHVAEFPTVDLSGKAG
ncbi:hypothetical protein BJ546DRAFT_1061617 [Cryomyces antarcticus]|uniref:Uncharacterized protein n=1 Tax=Cryomyces antarcticus TaxID=329879 RepID=A0ABR0LT07_9PEZI|nr:hypothetical protein LTR60_001486 [Cryomyces antarcticus]KAK5019681.1 hypothetical protein LTR39_000211 [Cryomyces antarcticus]KAK5202109.1 hypothetical protein LTR16_000337 [Cryomyces antarcticus]